MFIVNKNLLYPFESLISVLYKLSYIDKLEYQDSLKLFGIKQNRCGSAFLRGNSARLVDFFKIQPSRYFLANKDYIEKASSNTCHPLRPENIIPFVFCHKCAERNYHAVFHNEYFRVCLIHGCVLSNKCPSCKIKDIRIKSGFIYCPKCKYKLFDENKYLLDEEFKKLILKEVTPFQKYINRHVKDSDLYNVQNFNVCNILGSDNFKKLMFNIKKYYFWMSVVLKKPFLYTSIDYLKLAPLEDRFYRDNNDWLEYFVCKNLRQFKQVYMHRFTSLIKRSNLSNETKLEYIKKTKQFQRIWQSNEELGLRLRCDLKDIGHKIVIKYKNLLPYLLRKRLITYLRLAYFDTIIGEKYFTKKYLRRPYIDYIYFYVFVTDGRRIEVFVFDQRPMFDIDKRFCLLAEQEKKSNNVECFIYQIDIKVYVSCLYPYAIFES